MVVLDRLVAQAAVAPALELQSPKAEPVDREPLEKAGVVMQVHRARLVEVSRNRANKTRMPVAVDPIRMDADARSAGPTNSRVNVQKSRTAVSLVPATSSVTKRIALSGMSAPLFKSARAAEAARPTSGAGVASR